jgi:hypothetical protein
MEGAYEYEHTSGVHIKRCRFCTNELDRKCQAKPGRKSVRLNKKRSHCKKYVPDENKLASELMKKEAVTVVRRPDWFWMNKEELTKLAATMMAQQMVQSTASRKDEAHPTTGDLTRFLTEDE